MGEIAGFEGFEIVAPLAHADEMHGQGEFFRDGDENAAARGAVKLGHDEARHPRHLAEDLHLAHGVLAHGGVEHQQHRMGRASIDLLHDAHDLLQFRHQLLAVLQAPGGVHHQHIHAIGLRLGDRVEGEARRIRALRSGDDLRADALAPDLQLLDRGGAEGVARRQHHALSFSCELPGELADCGGLARAVHAHHENHEGLLGGIDDERLGHGQQHLLDFAGENGLHLVRLDLLVVAALAHGLANAQGGGDPKVRLNENVFQLVEHGPVELALGEDLHDP